MNKHVLIALASFVIGSVAGFLGGKYFHKKQSEVNTENQTDEVSENDDSKEEKVSQIDEIPPERRSSAENDIRDYIRETRQNYHRSYGSKEKTETKKIRYISESEFYEEGYEQADIDYYVKKDAFYDSDDNEISRPTAESWLGSDICSIFDKQNRLYGTKSDEDPDMVYVRNDLKGVNYRVTCIREG